MIFQEIIAENLQEVFLAFLNNIYSYFSVTATIINLSLEHYLVMQLISFVLIGFYIPSVETPQLSFRNYFDIFCDEII